jgi:hypothetical protein
LFGLPLAGGCLLSDGRRIACSVCVRIDQAFGFYAADFDFTAAHVECDLATGIKPQ